jgi:hypothetical protein
MALTAESLLDGLRALFRRVEAEGGEVRVLRGPLQAIAYIEEHWPDIEADLAVVDIEALVAETELPCGLCDGFGEVRDKPCGSCLGVGQVTLRAPVLAGWAR